MRSRRLRTKLAVAAFAASGVMGGFVGCASLGAESLSGAVDFCFLFDCTDGIFGGLIDPCSPVFSRPQTPGFIAADVNTPETDGNLFSDCPDDQP